jgi:nucleoside-diphosphate-sugar epimerase
MKKILITGATGFVGSRLVTRFCMEKVAEVRCYLRHFSRAAGIARFPIEFFQGEIEDLSSLQKAMVGSDAVVHAAMAYTGNAAEDFGSIVKGTANVCRAALQCKIPKLVYFSTYAVYGFMHKGRIDESFRHPRTNSAYGRLKQRAEEAVYKIMPANGSTSTTILQPTVIYGPQSHWSAGALAKLRGAGVLLPEKGSGICPAVYIDDVVDGVLCALESHEPGVSTYLISGPDRLTWLEFFEAHKKILGRARILMPETSRLIHAAKKAARANSSWRRLLALLKNNQDLRNEIKKVPLVAFVKEALKGCISRDAWRWLQEKYLRNPKHYLPRPGNGEDSASPPQELTMEEIAFYSSTLEPDCSKADQEIGFRPKYSFAEGIKRTSEWAKWANLTSQ